jgi:hypothetical protein
MFRRIIISLCVLFVPLSLFAEGGFVVESIGNIPGIDARKILVRNVLSADMMYFSYTALRIILDTNQLEPRGKMQGRTITLAPSVRQDAEFVKLLTHEVAHYLDIYFLSPKTPRAVDPSERFYAISWIDKTTKKSNETLSNFVS